VETNLIPPGETQVGERSSRLRGRGTGVDRSAKPAHVLPLRILGTATIQRHVASTLRHTDPRDMFLKIGTFEQNFVPGWETHASNYREN
jgi:hypothetical protein